MKTIVIYHSQTGFTRRYAEWIAEAAGADCVPLGAAGRRDLAAYDAIVFGSWLCAGGVSKLAWFRRRLPGWQGKKLVAYTYHGYWKDVGTIASLHQANMDLLMSGDSSADLFSGGKRIYTEDNHATPQYIGPIGTAKDSLINQGAVIRGEVDHCVISSDVYVDDGAKAINCVLMNGAHIKKGARVFDAIVGPDAVVEESEVINADRKEIILVTNGRNDK